MNKVFWNDVYETAKPFVIIFGLAILGVFWLAVPDWFYVVFLVWIIGGFIIMRHDND